MCSADFLTCADPHIFPPPEGMYIEPDMQAWGLRILRERELVWEREGLQDELAEAQKAV